MPDWTHDPTIEAQLHELSKYDTCSSFCRAFYAYIAQLLDTQSPGGEVYELFREFMDLTLRYHRQVEAIGDREEASLADLQSVADKRRISLEYLIERAEALLPNVKREAAALRLIKAECCFHVRWVARAVDNLEQAMLAGATDPLVCFALGYNRYVLAIETFSEAGEKPGEWVTRDAQAFRAACLDAVTAFEKGIVGGEMDPQLYWWIAHVLESAGLDQAAGYTRGQASDNHTDSTPPPNLTIETASLKRDLPPITEEEVRVAAELLKGRFSIEDILGTE